MTPKVEVTDRYYHVRIRNPDKFVIIRVPKWAARVASSVCDGAKVKMGKTKRGKWYIQSVMIPREKVQVRLEVRRKVQARRLASKVVRRITSV